MRLYGIPIRWKTVIAEFNPEAGFVDVQLSGPYRSWRHRHSFKALSTSTEMIDVVEYEMPYGLLGSIIHALFVRSALQRIFAYRNAAILEHFHRDE